MRTAIIIEARMSSTRLPGKVLKPILGRPMLDLMIERLKRVVYADCIVVATTNNPADDAIVEVARNLGVSWFRGSEEDVLDRVLRAARSVHADLIVEITGDCPLADPFLADQIIATFKTNSVDYCTHGLVRTYPLGMDVQVFPVNILAKVADLTQDPADREHVTLYIYEHPEQFRLLNLASGLPPEAAELRLTVDTMEDFRLVELIFGDLYPTKPDFNLQDILRLIDQQPELAVINRHIVQKPAR